MQSNPASKSSIWWKSALKSAAWNLATGLAIGFIAALAIYAFVPNAVFGISMANVVNFVTTQGAATFSPLPLMVFNGIISAAVGLFTGGSAAVEAHQQQQRNAHSEAKIAELDGRTRAIEHAITTPARHVQKILETGPRTNHLDTALARTAEASTRPTLH